MVLVVMCLVVYNEDGPRDIGGLEDRLRLKG